LICIIAPPGVSGDLLAEEFPTNLVGVIAL
jgi:hypothetical protein